MATGKLPDVVSVTFLPQVDMHGLITFIVEIETTTGVYTSHEATAPVPALQSALAQVMEKDDA